MGACIVLVVSTVLVLYEALRLTSRHLSDLPIRPRARIVAVVIAVFAAHTTAVWIYACAYWLLVLQFGLGGFAGVPFDGFQDCLYFSAVSYTTLGFGDHVPISHARLLTGVEALNGLTLIGWSASYTYLVMERYWPLTGGHRRRKDVRAKDVRAKTGAGKWRSEPVEPPRGPASSASPDDSAMAGSATDWLRDS
jgi:hypothetical protein